MYETLISRKLHWSNCFSDPRLVPPPAGTRPRAPPGCRHARSAAAEVTGLPPGPRTCCRPGAAPRCLLSGPRRASAAPSVPPSFPPCLPGAGWRRHCARARRAAAPSGRESPSGETGRRRRRPPQDGAAPKERLRLPASSARPRAGAPLPPRGTPGVVVRQEAAPRPRGFGEQEGGAASLLRLRGGGGRPRGLRAGTRRRWRRWRSSHQCHGGIRPQRGARQRRRQGAPCREVLKGAGMFPGPLQPRIAQRADTSTLINAGPLAVASVSPQTASLRVRQAAEPFRCATAMPRQPRTQRHEKPPQLLSAPVCDAADTYIRVCGTSWPAHPQRSTG